MGLEHVMHVAALFDVLFPDLVEFERERGMMPPEFAAFTEALEARILADWQALQRIATIHLPGSERYDPDGVGLTVVWADPTAPDAEAALMSQGEMLSYMMWYYLVMGEDVRTRGGGAYAGDNRHVVYRGEGWSPEDEADLNARVPRYEADPMAVRYWTFHYEPSGALQIPLVSIMAPGGSPQSLWAYADRVNRSGASELFSHWPIPTREQAILRQNMATALVGLVDWLETGVPPTWPMVP